MSTEPNLVPGSLYLGLFLLQWLFNLVIAAWVYFSKADNKNAKATEEVGKKLDTFIAKSNERMASLETTVQHLPTDEEIASLREDVASTKAKVEGIDDLVRRIEHQQNLIYQHLLNK